MVANQDSWPYQEAKKVLELVQKKGKTVATFECGFGPSGSPHIGTVAEMLRTRLVIEAFTDITANLVPSGEHSESYYQVEWILFADDLDALRKVPKNVPNPKKLKEYIGVPVCDIPDPYENHESYATSNIWWLTNSLEFFGLTMNDYKLLRASQMYRPANDKTPGIFNNAIKDFAERAHEIKDIVTHDYREERKLTYCPFLPIVENGQTLMDLYDWRVCQTTNNEPWMLHFYTEPLIGPANESERRAKMISLYDGNCKLQWKADWPLRWYALDVDYEMHGKDLLGSAQVGDRIMRLMGREPPIHMMYELFLNESGRKISKSDGTNEDLHDWCHYTIPEVMIHFLKQNPSKARKLHFGLIPQMTDDYLKSLDNNQPPISFSMLLNLVSITNTESREVLWGFIQNYVSDATPRKYPILDKLVSKALNYYEIIIKSSKHYRGPTDWEKVALIALRDSIKNVKGQHDATVNSGKDLSKYGGENKVLEEALTTAIYDVGKEFYGVDKLRDFFRMIYRVLMGQESGPRLPIFVLLYGIDNTVKLIDEKIE